jgi:uroporphyrinogen III methyltransferase/synthase
VSPTPLAGQTVVVTRAPEQSGELVALLRERGARVLEVPTLVMVPVADEDARHARARVRAAAEGAHDVLLFTSRNAVAFFHELVLASGLTPAALGQPLFAIGPATARALVERGYGLPTVASEAVAEGLLAKVREVVGEKVAGLRFLLPRAREGREVLLDGLRQAGAEVELLVLYETRPITDGPALPAGPIDWVTFASPSSVRAFHQRFGLPQAKIACIGPVTAKAVVELGGVVLAMGAEHTARGMVEAMSAR